MPFLILFIFLKKKLLLLLNSNLRPPFKYYKFLSKDKEDEICFDFSCYKFFSRVKRIFGGINVGRNVKGVLELYDWIISPLFVLF